MFRETIREKRHWLDKLYRDGRETPITGDTALCYSSKSQLWH